MTATSHAVVGSFIAARFADPVAALPIAFVSHYLLDIIPHWDSATNRKNKSDRKLLTEAVIDGTVAVLASGFIYWYFFGLTDFIYLYLVVGVAVLPDIVTIITRFLVKKDNPIWNWNNKLQIRLNQRMQLPWGIFTQIISLGVIYIFLFTIFV